MSTRISDSTSNRVLIALSMRARILQPLCVYGGPPRPWIPIERRLDAIRKRKWSPDLVPLEDNISEGFATDYGDKDIQQMTDIVSSPSEAVPLSGSKEEMRRILTKHGLRSEALYGTSFGQMLNTYELSQHGIPHKSEGEEITVSDWLFGDRELLDEKKDILWKPGELDREMDRVDTLMGFSEIAMQEHEYNQLFDKAMRLHHAQRERSRNLYAETIWYAKKLERAEIQDVHEMMDKNPIPTFIRAFFTLEEEFDKLNDGQEEREIKYSERVDKIIQEDYEEFLQSEAMNIPAEPGERYHTLLRSRKGDTEDDSLPEIEIDDYMHDMLPNATTDKKKEKLPDYLPDWNAIDLLYRTGE